MIPGTSVQVKSDAVGLGIEIEIGGRDERARDGAGVVHRAVKAVDAAARLVRREARQHRVARATSGCPCRGDR